VTLHRVVHYTSTFTTEASTTQGGSLHKHIHYTEASSTHRGVHYTEVSTIQRCPLQRGVHYTEVSTTEGCLVNRYTAIETEFSRRLLRNEGR